MQMSEKRIAVDRIDKFVHDVLASDLEAIAVVEFFHRFKHNAEQANSSISIWTAATD
jgi:hypothetical protein